MSERRERPPFIAPDGLPIEQRVPVVEKHEDFSIEKIAHQWRLITEAIRQDVLAKPEVREALLPYTVTPVNESLPGQLLESLRKVDSRVENLCTRYQSELVKYLNLPPVPDALITPDIANAASYRDVDWELKWQQQSHEEPEEGEESFDQWLARARQEEYFKKLDGLTSSERIMVATRYAWARDVKLLALSAELMEQGNKLQLNETGECTLPSGINLVVRPENPQEQEDALHPERWEKRVQLKDRVYEIGSGGARYILKEKKTARHLHTKKGGHQPGSLSSEEFATARHFQEHATIDQGDVRISWERPIGFASYPDGFSFTLFAYREGLGEKNQVIVRILAEEILKHRSAFEEEYAVIREEAKRQYDNPATHDEFKREGLSPTLLRLRLRSIIPAPNLTFERFAMIKAIWMRDEAIRLMKRTILTQGYKNSDMDGYAFVAHAEQEKVQLEIVGFDFEYFTPISPEQTIHELAWDRIHNLYALKNHALVGTLSDGSEVTRLDRAAYFAMVKGAGGELPIPGKEYLTPET